MQGVKTLALLPNRSSSRNEGRRNINVPSYQHIGILIINRTVLSVRCEFAYMEKSIHIETGPWSLVRHYICKCSLAMGIFIYNDSDRFTRLVSYHRIQATKHSWNNTSLWSCPNWNILGVKFAICIIHNNSHANGWYSTLIFRTA